MRALVTGATGFVGSRLARALAEAGHPTSIVVRRSSNLAPLRGALDRLRVFTLAERNQNLAEIVRDAAPEVVFHLATCFVSEHGPTDVAPMIAANLLFPCELVEAMANHGARYLVNTGTSWQHFESAGYRPVGLHAATKQAFEDLLEYYVDTGSLRAITLKLSDTYGPEDSRPRLLQLLASHVGRSDPLPLSPGEQQLDLVYIDDVVPAYLGAAERLLAGKVERAESWAVSSRRPVPLRALVAEFEAAFGVTLNIRWGGRPYRAREVMAPWTGGAPLPGWAAKVDLARGLRMIAERTACLAT